MSRIYLVTGAAGHLGNTIVRKLMAAGENVRALVLPGETMTRHMDPRVDFVMGDVCDRQDLERFFTLRQEAERIVIHAAGIVSIASGYDRKVYDVNVGGTRNVIAQCEKDGVKKLVYVSSVHAIPEKPPGETMAEAAHFDPDKVRGLYAKTKAEATQLVLDAAGRGLPACVVHPSGIIGPFDYGRGHMTQLFVDYAKGRLTAGVAGGYDFVDVRDVADGILACCEKGRDGECYILSNRYLSVPDLLALLQRTTHRRPVRTILPQWFARAAAPFAEVYYKLLRQPPLYTAYSMDVLCGNALFSHEKADRELGYETTPIEKTVADTVEWLKVKKRI